MWERREHIGLGNQMIWALTPACPLTSPLTLGISCLWASSFSTVFKCEGWKRTGVFRPHSKRSKYVSFLAALLRDQNESGLNSSWGWDQPRASGPHPSLLSKVSSLLQQQWPPQHTGGLDFLHSCTFSFSSLISIQGLDHILSFQELSPSHSSFHKDIFLNSLRT